MFNICLSFKQNQSCSVWVVLLVEKCQYMWAEMKAEYYSSSPLIKWWRSLLIEDVKEQQQKEKKRKKVVIMLYQRDQLHSLGWNLNKWLVNVIWLYKHFLDGTDIVWYKKNCHTGKWNQQTFEELKTFRCWFSIWIHQIFFLYCICRMYCHRKKQIF